MPIPDREKVIKAIEHHKETAVCNGCPYAGDDDTPQGNCPVYDDAIALLREQEPVAPRYKDPYHAYCGACGCRIPLKIKARYCHKCGKAVKWNADLQTQ